MGQLCQSRDSFRDRGHLTQPPVRKQSSHGWYVFPMDSQPDQPCSKTQPAEWCVQRDFGFAAGCVWVLASSAEMARDRGEPVLRSVFPTSPPAGPVETFLRSEYHERAGPKDFTAGVRLTPPAATL